MVLFCDVLTGGQRPRRGSIDVERSLRRVAPPPGYGLYPFAGGSTHAPSRPHRGLEGASALFVDIDPFIVLLVDALSTHPAL